MVTPTFTAGSAIEDVGAGIARPHPAAAEKAFPWGKVPQCAHWGG